MSRRTHAMLALWLAGLLGCGPTRIVGGEDTATLGSESSGDSTDTGEEPEHCGYVALQSEYLPPVVMFVVDTSPSMGTLWDHDGDPDTPTQTRWASAHALIEDIAEVLGAGPVVGLQRFPSAEACPDPGPWGPSCADPSACSVAGEPELPLFEGAATQLSTALPGPSDELELKGASPAAAAYAKAVAELLGDSYEGSFRGIVLLTDGHINCGSEAEPPDNFTVYDESLRSLIEDAKLEHEIDTYVIAVDEAAEPQLVPGPDMIPDFDPRPSLHELGLAGGVAYRDPNQAYLSASDPDVLLVFSVEPPIETCAIELAFLPAGPPSPEQIPLVSWAVDGEPIPYVEAEACDAQTGWTWWVSEDVEAGEVVVFCGSACQAMNDGALMEGWYGCP